MVLQKHCGARYFASLFISLGLEEISRAVSIVMVGLRAAFAKNGLADESSRGNPLLTVMQATELRDLDDLADTRDLPRNRTLLLQPQMGPRSVVVNEIRRQSPL